VTASALLQAQCLEQATQDVHDRHRKPHAPGANDDLTVPARPLTVRLSGFPKLKWDAVALATAVLLVLAIVFGGASRQHALRLALVELAALPLLFVAAARISRDGIPSACRTSLFLVGSLCVLPLLQVVPLPPQIWTSLAGRDQLSLALSLAEIPEAWLPLSLTPERTWRSFLALLPPVSMFLAMLVTPGPAKMRWVYLLLGMASISLVLGGLQIASGSTRFYPWATTAAGNMVGFFANRNHLATLLLICIPFAAVIAAGSLRRGGDSRAPLWLGAIFIGLCIIALAAIRSRAGIILATPCLILSFLAAWIATGSRRPPMAFLGLIGAAALALGVIGAVALPPLLNRFDPGATPEGRFENWPVVASAAETYLPLGSGIGSFDAVYRSVEPLERLDPLFFNQAHNEYLETWLEAGWLGAALILAFLVWWGRRSWAAWRSPPSGAADLQRAASVAILMVLLHSGVDYPLRTVAIAVVFAMCAAFLEGAALPIERVRRRVRTD